jgi:hypothetical protein
VFSLSVDKSTMALLRDRVFALSDVRSGARRIRGAAPVHTEIIPTGV